MADYTTYQNELTRIADLAHSVGVLHWDLEVNMPSGGAAVRSRQIATLSGMAHEMATSDKIGSLLNDLINDQSLNAYQRRNIELSLKDFNQQRKLDTAFVEKMAATQSQAYTNWVKARSASDFSIFAPSLEALINLKREEAEIRGYEDKPYDALLDLYETGLTSRMLDKVFGDAKAAIVPFLKQVRAAEPTNNDFLRQHYDKDEQWEFGLEVLDKMGYDFNRGRQDLSPHPFTISFSPDDVRVTTRVDENDFLNMTWSCIHEGGHALYEQGLKMDQYATPAGSSVSLAIHESQSRLWENHVGRSQQFWKFWYPKLQARFPQNLQGVPLDQFYRGINQIEPNLIRTEADELHYHMHVMIRYEIEQSVINDGASVNELPELWNSKYKEYMDVDVPSDDVGILQDIHWSHGSFGYFPTYSLGSFYAAQFYDFAIAEHPDIPSAMEMGDYSTLLAWLRKNIHQHGRQFDPEDLCRRITGKPLDISHYVDYVKAKYAGIYTLNL